MHQIYHHLHVQTVSSIHQGLEIMRCSKSRWNTKEIRAVVTKRSIIWMLNNSHYLDHLIPQFMYFRQNILPEWRKSVHLLLLSRHTNMTLINTKTFIFPLWLLVFPFIRIQLHMNTVKRFVLVLPCEVYPSWNTILMVPILKLNINFNSRILRNWGWYLTSPLPKIILDKMTRTLSHRYSPLFQLLNSPKIEIPLASGAHSR